jgi:hypothetical protein
LILFLEGGYYFDMDTNFLFKKGQQFIEESFVSGFIRGDEFAEQNCFIAAVPHHPIMAFTLLDALTNYERRKTSLLGRAASLLKLSVDEKLTLSDAKRWPYSKLGNNSKWFVMGRRELTIASPGPSSLGRGITTFWEEYKSLEKNQDKHEKMWKSLTSVRHDSVEHNQIRFFMGKIECRALYHKSWLQIPKKVTGFDDREINTDHLLTELTFRK